MGKIKGKFAPLFEELSHDERWLLTCNDRQKFIYLLVLYTCYLCNNSAPIDPRYYKIKYALRHRLDTIRADLAHIQALFPTVLCKNKKLSLSNYKGYENRVDHRESLEIEIEEEIERDVSKTSSPEKPSLETLKQFFVGNGSNSKEAECFYDHFASNGWKVGGKAAMKDWKAASRNWIRRNLNNVPKQQEVKKYAIDPRLSSPQP